MARRGEKDKIKDMSMSIPLEVVLSRGMPCSLWWYNKGEFVGELECYANSVLILYSTVVL